MNDRNWTHGVELSPGPPWLSAATTILHAARNSHWETAALLAERIVADYGPGVIVDAMAAWIDTYAHVCGVAEDKPVTPHLVGFVNTGTGDFVDADGAPLGLAWAGRLITARLADDESTFNALINAVPDEETWSDCVDRVLSLVALGINVRLGQTEGAAMATWNERGIPNPGSDEAVELGCRCPQLDNCRGRMPPHPPNGWWLSFECTVHAVSAREQNVDQ